jgi:MoxR-like ATPase
MTPRESFAELKKRMSRSIIGQESVIENLLLVLLVNGNLLLEGLPGLAKTRAIKSLAKALDAGLSRIQFTPDLLPSDIVGTEIYQSESTGGGTFRFQAGPIFNNLILADEINRAPAKVQSALLEAMEERQVTVAGKTHKLPDLFMVLATQNPIEQEGTYPLPEAQMDRFVMHVLMTYPDEGSEVLILRLVHGEESAPAAADAPIAQEAIFKARAESHDIHVSEAIEKYIVQIVGATRYPKKLDAEIAGWIEFGASPRGSIALHRTSRAKAWLEQRDYVTPEDVRAVVYGCLRHRLILSYEGKASGVTPDRIIRRIVELVAVA